MKWNQDADSHTYSFMVFLAKSNMYVINNTFFKPHKLVKEKKKCKTQKQSNSASQTPTNNI